MKRIVATLLAVCTLFALCGCRKITKDNVGSNEVYDKTLGVGIRLGMKKSEIDKLLGDPVTSSATFKYGDYIYGDGNLQIAYEDGRATWFIVLDDARWKTKFNAIGMTEAMLSSLSMFEDIKDGDYVCYYKGKNNLVADASQADHMVSYAIGGDEVIGIFIVSLSN